MEAGEMESGGMEQGVGTGPEQNWNTGVWWTGMPVILDLTKQYGTPGVLVPWNLDLWLYWTMATTLSWTPGEQERHGLIHQEVTYCCIHQMIVVIVKHFKWSEQDDGIRAFQSWSCLPLVASVQQHECEN
ncbi:hypothetical protein BTVI_04088 [Pitangus sulphuratus]|nr:hypothetical protein BTVI_04088 [Pitangus sulphuratus]